MSITIIEKRALSALNLKQYSEVNRPEMVVGEVNLNTPTERQYILRMLIKKPFGEFKIPKELKWCEKLIAFAQQNQMRMGINQPFCHITVRSGIVDSVNDDEWHVDGFSQTITHLPEQNYIWVDKIPTEVALMGMDIPYDFDSQKHNIHYLINDVIESEGKESDIFSLKEKAFYCLDPYVIHRRPKLSQGMQRTFVRISFTPIEIEDSNNTQNPLMPRIYDRDGVSDFRDKLIRYKL